MKKIILILSSFLIIGSLMACSSDATSKADIQQENNKPKESTGLANDNDSTSQMDDNETVALTKERMKLGLTKEEVENILGSGYQKIKASDDDSEMWRYDFGTNVNYTSPENEYDFGDVTGIQNGHINAQLFISWTDENTVSDYSVLYLNNGDGRVYDYRVFSDGGEKEQAITN